jgi:hypothetical protein
MFVIVAFDEDLCIWSSLLSTMGVFVFCRVPPRVCVYNSFFCQKLLTSGYEGVCRWKNKIVSSSHCMHAFVYLFNVSDAAL